MKTPPTSDALLCDIGGTRIRFMLASADLSKEFGQVDSDGRNGAVTDLAIQTLGSGTPFERALTKFFTHNEGLDRSNLDLWVSMAADVRAHRIQFENLAAEWQAFDRDYLSGLGFRNVHLFNDYEAIGWSLPEVIHEVGLQKIGGGVPRSGERLAILGVGTSLGAALLFVNDEGKYLPIPSEFGTTDRRVDVPDLVRMTSAFADGGLMSRADIDMRRGLGMDMEQWRSERVWRREFLSSGLGLRRMYAWRRHRLDMRENDHDIIQVELTDPKSIVGYALGLDAPANADREAAEQVLRWFCQMLADDCRQFVRFGTARGGVFLVGPIVNAIGRSGLLRFGFMDAFQRADRKDAMEAEIPVYLVPHQYPGLLGLQRLATHLTP